MSVTSQSTILTSSTGLQVKNGLVVKDSTVARSGTFYLNTATTVNASTGTTIASSNNQWSLCSSLKNANATSLLNNSGSFQAPADGDYTLSMSVVSTSSVTLTSMELWFIYSGAAGTFAPRLGWQKISTSMSPPALHSTIIISAYKGDVVTPWIYQTNANNSSISLYNGQGLTNPQLGTSSSGSTLGCIFTIRQDALTS